MYDRELIETKKKVDKILARRTIEYQQGYADAIDEFVKAVEKCVAMQWVDIQDIWEIQEKLKEHKQ